MPVTLFDRLFQLAADQGWVVGPAVPSYTNDIYPILERARQIQAVRNVSGHHSTWPDPVYDATLRQSIFAKLANPSTGPSGGADMPDLQEGLTFTDGDRLTPTQHSVMQKWKDDNFNRDWAGPPAPGAITPAGLDQAALRAAVGAAFYPGIETGGEPTAPILDHTLYVGAADPMRLDHASLQPGDISRYMALPWQADFNACSYGWWPVPRPNDVIPQGTTVYQAWDRSVGSGEDMVTKWSTLGFIVEQGGSFVEVERCDTVSIQLVTPHLGFQDVPQGPMGMSRKTALAFTFEVTSTGSPVTLEVQPGDGPTFSRLTLNASSVTVGPTAPNTIVPALLWLTQHDRK